MKHVKQDSSKPKLSNVTTLTNCFVLLMSIALATSVNAKAMFSPDDPDWDDRLNQLIQYEGLIIDSIIINNRNIYDTTKANRNTFLFKTANKLHTVTRKKIIHRELLFKVGEPFNLELARETARNLRTNFELYDAHISASEKQNGHIIVYLKTIDQWSTFIKPRFVKDSDKSNFHLTMEERNLAGNNQFLGFDYYDPGDEKAFVAGRFYDQRFSKLSFSLDLEYNDNPENIIRRISFIKPYYNLSQSWSFEVSLAKLNGRRDFLIDSSLVVQSHRKGDRFTSFVKHRWGSYKNKIGINFGYVYYAEKAGSILLYDTVKYKAEMVAEDSTYHSFQIGTSFSSIYYVSLTRINGMGYPEDFVYGHNFSVDFGRTFDSKFNNNLFDRIGITVSKIHVLNHNLITANFRKTKWLKEGNDIQSFTDASLQWYNFDLHFMTMAFSLKYQKLSRVDQLDLLSLGGLNSIRGYSEFYKTGNKRLTFNTEARLFTGVDILTALLGGVVFWDVGRIWSYHSENNPTWDHSFGIGLRISMEKTSRSKIFRIDFAHPKNNQWEILIGTGQYF